MGNISQIADTIETPRDTIQTKLNILLKQFSGTKSTKPAFLHQTDFEEPIYITEDALGAREKTANTAYIEAGAMFFGKHNPPWFNSL